ncbi:GNAT family N-acetyltransferase [Nocardia sp. NPDC051981]|uniref:N-acetylglutamate synthase, CG3035 family n=1 Tax=Nocardia sp. NPDC051981 TaxID=3155417 RepID=UPI0034315A5B
MTDSELPPIGKRVVVRYRLPAGYPQPLTDVIGELIEPDPLTVRTADGQVVSIAWDRVVAWKPLGPRPIRTSEIRALEAAAADGWPGLRRSWIGGWLLRAGDGYTNRANSAVPLGGTDGPALMDTETLHRIAEWYTAHGLPAQFQLPDRLATLPAGWRSWNETQVLAVDIETMALPSGPPMVRFSVDPDGAWLSMHRHRGGDAELGSTPVVEVLTAVRDGQVAFATLGLQSPLAIGRVAVTTAPDGRCWAGLTCVVVANEHRRHGLGALVCAEMIRWGQSHGATHAYVQVSGENDAALALYQEMGFVEHHRYRYAAP